MRFWESAAVAAIVCIYIRARTFDCLGKGGDERAVGYRHGCLLNWL